MPNKMERFTQRARRVLVLAQESAEQLKHSYIGTEHLLLGLFREEGGLAGRVLRDLGINEQRRVEEVLKELTPAEAQTTNTALDLAPATKRVLELAVREARTLGHHYIGTEHLLLALVSQSESVAVDILKRCGVSPDEVRRQTLWVLQESPVQAAHPPVPPLESTHRQVPPMTSQGQAFQVLTAAITRILDMVEANTLTTAQAAELFGGLQAYLKPSTSEAALLIAQSLGAKLPEGRVLRVVVRDITSGRVQLEAVMPLIKSLERLDGLVSAAASDYVGWLWTTDMDDKNRIEVRVEKDEAESDPPAQETDNA
jgi:hypothetical protein